MPDEEEEVVPIPKPNINETKKYVGKTQADLIKPIPLASANKPVVRKLASSKSSPKR